MVTEKKKIEFSGGRNPLLGGLHLTFDAHFRTWMSYSCQKSCVKIWFGLVGIGGVLIFRRSRSPLLWGVTGDLRCPFLYMAEIFQSKVCVKIWFGLVEPFKSYHGNRKKKKLNFPGSRNPQLGGLHLTFDAHFRTRMSCSSQKSYERIFFFFFFFFFFFLKFEVC